MRRDLATGRAALVIQAGTATSTRLRDEEQSFNLIEIVGRATSRHGAGWDGKRLRLRRRATLPPRRALGNRDRRVLAEAPTLESAPVRRAKGRL